MFHRTRIEPVVSASTSLGRPDQHELRFSPSLKTAEHVVLDAAPSSGFLGEMPELLDPAEAIASLVSTHRAPRNVEPPMDAA
jgi:hypothetical protein